MNASLPRRGHREDHGPHGRHVGAVDEHAAHQRDQEAPVADHDLGHRALQPFAEGGTQDRLWRDGGGEHGAGEQPRHQHDRLDVAEPATASSLLRAQGTPSKTSTRPLSSEYSAPTTSRPSAAISRSMQLRPVPQVVRRGAHVGAHRLAQEALRVELAVGRQQALHRGPDAVHDRAHVARVRAVGAPQLLQRGDDGAALRVAQHHDQAGAEAVGRELHAADLRGSHHVPGHADHEQVPQPLVEDDLGRHARIGAAQDDRRGLLARHQLGAPHEAGEAVAAGRAGDEAPVALPQARQRLQRAAGQRPLTSPAGTRRC